MIDADADYIHAKRVCKDFKIKHLDEYHNLFLKSNTLLLADIFENFRKMCLKIYHLDSVNFLPAPVLARQTALKKTEVKLELLTNIDIRLMVKKDILGGICHAIHRYANANNKYMKYYDKNKESSYLKYWGVNDLYGWAMLQKLLGNKFERIKDTSKFNESFIKSYDENSAEGYFLEADIQYPENLHKLHNDLPFLPEKIEIEKVEKFVANLHDKTGYVMHIRNL